MHIDDLKLTDFTASELENAYKALVWAEMCQEQNLTSKFNLEELKQFQVKVLEAKIFVSDRENVINN